MNIRKIAYVIGGFLLLPLQMLQGAGDSWDVDEGMRHLESFGENTAKKYQMKYLNKGVGTVVDSKNVAWDFSLMADRAWTIDQARPVVLSIMNDFWYMSSQDSAIIKHMQKYGAMEPRYNPVLTPKRLGLKIAFWDKNVNRPLPPYVSQIIVSEGTIKYYMCNPKDQSLQAPITESWEPASQPMPKSS